MHVLVIAPHPDDEAIGCGGALCLHKRAGDRLNAVFLSSGELGLKNLPREEAWRTREKEARKSCSILGIQAIEFFRGPDWTLSEAAGEIAPRLASFLRADPPDMIYLPIRWIGIPITGPRCRFFREHWPRRKFLPWKPAVMKSGLLCRTTISPRTFRK